MDQRPFDEEDAPGRRPPDKEIDLIYYVRFSDRTQLVVTLYK